VTSQLVPWYRRVYRWGQTNLTEIDPIRCDLAFWREHWRRTRVQGVIINAGGIVAYYRSRFELTHYAEYLGERDLFGELVEAARQEGLAVLARMDSNRVYAPLAQAHPDWIAMDREGRPYRAGDLYITSVFSPYYQEYLPDILREIARQYHPDGFADNSFSGLGRASIDYNPYAAAQFRQATGLELPACPDWNDPAYRAWIQWNYDRRLEIWDLNNQAAQSAGGPDCLWIGMVGSDPVGQGSGFRDLRRLAGRARMLLLDSQSRPQGGSFQQNSEAGMLLHNLAGWDTLIAESMAMYEHNGPYPFRLASKPEPEARLWAVAGFAGGILPWWHHIGAYHEDRRQYQTAQSLFRWHEANQAYLLDRRPVAPVGVVWSQENADFYGRDEARLRVEQPWQGFTRALGRSRILYQPLHIEDVAEARERGITALVFPNLGAMSERQAQAIRAFVAEGGALIATGETGRYDEWGDARAVGLLDDLFGVRSAGPALGSEAVPQASWEDWSRHTYLRLTPELRARVYGPLTGAEPLPAGRRHPVLAGFEETDLLPFGGRLEVVELTAGDALAPLTYVPPCPVYPPETAWMRDPGGRYPALALRELPNGARLALLMADIDRCYARNPLPDYARLLANLVHWALNDPQPVVVEGPGLLDCRLYRQGERLILHLVNLTGTDPRPAAEFIRVGPVDVTVRWKPSDLLPLPRQSGTRFLTTVRLLAAERKITAQIEDGWLRFRVPEVVDHEVIVIE